MDELLKAKTASTMEAREHLWLLADRLSAMKVEIARMLHDYDASYAVDAIVFAHEAVGKLLTAMRARIAEIDRRIGMLHRQQFEDAM